jgi:hypothetical protein
MAELIRRESRRLSLAAGACCLLACILAAISLWLLRSNS